jgi:hypothetical protein
MSEPHERFTCSGVDFVTVPLADWQADRTALEHLRRVAFLRDGTTGPEIEKHLRGVIDSYQAARLDAEAKAEQLRLVISETFRALVAASPVIGDLATKGLPYAVEAFRDDKRAQDCVYREEEI